MTTNISEVLEAVEAQLLEQNQRLFEVTTQLESLPEELSIALDEEWKDDFERATDVRPRPAPVPQFPVLRV